MYHLNRTGLIILLLIATMLTGFEKSENVEYPSRAIMFALNDFMKISSFSGKTITYKTLTADGHERRYSLSLNGLVDQGENELTREQYYFESDSTDYTEESRVDGRNSLGISLGFIKINHSPNDNPFQFIAGYGPLLSLSGSYSTIDPSRGQSTSNRVYENTSFRVGFGARAIAGVEWFIRKNISLHAEYNPSIYYSYSWSKRVEETVTSGGNTFNSTSMNKDHRLGFYNSTILGLSVYF